MKIAVVGAGVIGATVAARLAQRGAQVTLLDQASAGSGTTSTSYAWVNSNGKEPPAYYQLNLAGLEAHTRMSPTDESGWLGLGGHIEFAVDDHHRDNLAARISRLKAWNYGVEEITPDQAKTLLPDIELPEGVQLIAHYTREGYAYPAKYLAHMLGEARDAGAVIRTGTTVSGFNADDDKVEVQLADGTSLPVQKVVSAVGRWTRPFAALAGASVPVREFAEPGDIVVGYLAVTNPVPVRLSRLITSPWLNVRPAGGGRLMLQALDLDITADPRNVPGPDSELAQIFLERLRSLLANTEDAKIQEILVGQRVMPEDGRTIVGPAPEAPWLYVVATHSGVTLAPYLGEAIAAEIFGEKQEAFEEFRIERFLTDSTYGQPYAPRKPGEQ
ncbi:FAD-dependent oxidoreductase [Pelagibacterium sp. H642]|uniref:NAD(P)/FAD-dependent oxidoreductase n=1 Tax=Pelagibacterium sp. H642 TaxID=1881069 RepID=UPI002814AAB0|nr:FAD-dependent oxidoreductase [Pelagibacterium sp. H642]WMT89373.1 FAD-binding oxidoreductase [Pelagibacterium sp. H642]